MKSSALDTFLEYSSLCMLIIKTLTIFLEYSSLCTLIIKTLIIFRLPEQHYCICLLQLWLTSKSQIPHR